MILRIDESLRCEIQRTYVSQKFLHLLSCPGINATSANDGNATKGHVLVTRALSPPCLLAPMGVLLSRAKPRFLQPRRSYRTVGSRPNAEPTTPITPRWSACVGIVSLEPRERPAHAEAVGPHYRSASRFSFVNGPRLVRPRAWFPSTNLPQQLPRPMASLRLHRPTVTSQCQHRLL